MIKIITALGNPIINKKLSKNKKIEIIEKDIQYKDAIIEIINKYKKINFIIISEKLPGEISNEEIKIKIKKINENIKIIFINEEKEKISYKTKLKNKINIAKNFEEYLVDIIFENIQTVLLKDSDNFMDNNIKKVEENFVQKEKILSKEKMLKKFKRVFILYIKIIKKHIKKYFLKRGENTQKNNKTKIYVVTGNEGIGKSIISINLAHFFIKKNRCVLLIETQETEGDIKQILNIKKINKRLPNFKKRVNIKPKTIRVKRNLYYCRLVDINFTKNYWKNFDILIVDLSQKLEKNVKNDIFKICNQILFLTEGNILEIEKDKKTLENYKQFLKIENKKIKLIINKNNKFSINKKIIKKILFNYKILGKIKNNNKYTYYINKNYKNIIFDRKIKKEYYKIINKLK